MRRPVALLALLVLAAAPVLAGCVGGDAAPPADDPGGVAPAGTRDDARDADGDDAPAPSTPAPAAGGGNTTYTPPPPPKNGTTNATTVPPPPPPPHTREVGGEGSVTAKASLPCEAPAPCPDVEHEAAPIELALPEPNPIAAAFLATWEAGQTSATLAFNVTTPEGVLVASGEGESPVAFSLPPELLKGVSTLVVRAAVPAPGVMAQQTYAVVVSLEYA